MTIQGAAIAPVLLIITRNDMAAAPVPVTLTRKDMAAALVPVLVAIRENDMAAAPALDPVTITGITVGQEVDAAAALDPVTTAGNKMTTTMLHHTFRWYEDEEAEPLILLR